MQTARLSLGTSATMLASLIFAAIIAFAMPTAHAAVEIAADGTCTVTGPDAYAYYMPPGNGVRIKCGELKDAEVARRASCPEMWSTVTNVSKADCRAPDDRRNVKHDPKKQD